MESIAKHVRLWSCILDKKRARRTRVWFAVVRPSSSSTTTTAGGRGDEDQRSRKTVVIGRQTYETDDWTNVSSRVLSLIGANLHLRPHHPLWRLKRRIVDHFYQGFRNARGNPVFSVHQDLSPVVTVRQNFDSLLVPADHVSRSRSDTYYVNRDLVLRAHTSAHQWDLIHSGLDNFLVVGDVYRRDAIDSSHYPVFHQMEGVRLCNVHQLERKTSTPGFRIFDAAGSRTATRQAVHTADAVSAMEAEMKSTIQEMSGRLFGRDTQSRWVDAYFPFTHPSWEFEILYGDEWMEVLGCGIMEHQLLQSAGAQEKIGWAFGFGLERLAMKLYAIPDIRLFWSQDTGFLSQFQVEDIEAEIRYKPISSCPQCINDISFWIPETFTTSDFLDLVRAVAGDLVEQVTLVDTFCHPKLRRHSHCYRIVYRHMERVLTQAEVNVVHRQIEDAATRQLNVTIR